MKKNLMIISFCCFGFLNAQNLLTGLRSCYSMDCNMINQAATGSVYDGNPLANTCATGHSSVPNTAYQFTGSSFMTLPQTLVLGAQIICASGWFEVSNNPHYLIYQSSTTCFSEMWSLYVQTNSSGPSFVVSRQVNGCSTPIVNLTSTPVVPGWHHVVFCITSTALYLWVDSTPYFAANSNFPVQTSNALVILGTNFSGNPSNTFNGKMDNLRFYDRLLTNAEVSDLYTNDPNCTSTGTPPPPPPPIPGNYCSGNQNGLTADYEVGLNGFTYNFTTPANTLGKVAIGRPNCGGTQARLMVSDDIIGNSIFASSSTSSNNIGVRGIGTDININPAATTFGIVGEAHKSNNNLTSVSAGVAGFCGVWNSAMMPSGQNIGVYGNSIANSGTWAGYFDGDVNINGNGWILAPWTFSDQRFKKDIKKLENVNERIKLLNAYTYNYRKGEFANRNFDDKLHIGFIAQEIKEVFPELVREDKDGFYGVDYQGMVPILLEAVKDQQQQIDELKALVQSLAGLPAGSKGGTSTNAVELSDKNAIVLNQNVPNPFAETTVITYNIPEDFVKAQIIFSTNDGKLIKVVDIIEKGAGSLNVFANDLTHGLYSYTLVIDGKTIDTKKMVKE